ncbi:transcriptional regulator domain-containing protein [Variovorax sp. GB1P17]|uniref:transcriptional regulator domain-containing protein n=1 Tax=Variovorax sp. GB1P17 TaxID=3443740 RepID=UPI003F484B14
MKMRDIDDLPRATWSVSAAYLYTLDLDGAALAWEYLRRNPQYRAEYGASERRRTSWFQRWGLRCRRRPTPGCSRGTPTMALVR